MTSGANPHATGKHAWQHAREVDHPDTFLGLLALIVSVLHFMQGKNEKKKYIFTNTAVNSGKFFVEKFT